MNLADDQSYEEVISLLQSFISDLGESVSKMQSAGQDCVDNTENDPAAESCNAKIQECCSKVQNAAESIQGVIAALQQELAKIQEAASKANSI